VGAAAREVRRRHPSVADFDRLRDAVDYLDELAWTTSGHEIEVTSYALDRLYSLPTCGLRPRDARDRTGVVSFNLDGVNRTMRHHPR